MMLTADDAAAKGWWTWAIKHGKPTLPETADMKKLLQRWEKEAGPKLEEAALKGKPSQVQKELEPFKELRDHWQLCLVELILAERKGLYEGAREAFFRPFKVDDSTRTRRDYRTMKHTTTLYVELLLKRGAVSEAGRIVSFMNRRYSLDNHTLAFEAAMVKDAEEETERGFPPVGAFAEKESQCQGLAEHRWPDSTGGQGSLSQSASARRLGGVSGFAHALLKKAGPGSDPMKYRILLLGSGGRESALAWKLSQSPLCGRPLRFAGKPRDCRESRARAGIGHGRFRGPGSMVSAPRNRSDGGRSRGTPGGWSG